jgi:hypothetical protein
VAASKNKGRPEFKINAGLGELSSGGEGDRATALDRRQLEWAKLDCSSFSEKKLAGAARQGLQRKQRAAKDNEVEAARCKFVQSARSAAGH